MVIATQGLGVLSRVAGAAELGTPSIVRRRQWGANEAMRGAGIAYDAVVENIVVHHTATHLTQPDWAAHIRDIYAFERGSGYGDIAYHYLIDPDGKIYEGRWARDFPDDMEPNAEDGRGWIVRGGHALGHNSRTLGIALLGDYSMARPSDAAITSLVAMLIWKCRRWNLDPLGTSIYVGASGLAESLPRILCHGDIRVTECPGSGVRQLMPELRRQVAEALGPVSAAPGGYRVVSRSGVEVALGATKPFQSDSPGRVWLAGIRDCPRGGYWAYGVDGGVFAYGAAQFHGSLGGHSLNAPVVGFAATPTGDGYWLVARDGGVFAFGAAAFHGSLFGAALQAPITGIASSPSGDGYWLCAADGGVFAFGDAQYHGSAGGAALNGAVIDIVSARVGYWLVAEDGGVFAFGGAPFLGRGTDTAPIVSLLPTPTERGYVLLTANGQVVPFGDAPYHGSAPGMIGNAVGIAGPLHPTST
jgi:hypothetical protein